MCAQLLLVGEEAGLLEFAHQAAQANDGGHQVGASGRIAADGKIALWQGVLGKSRGGTQVQHQVKGFGVCLGCPAEIDGARNPTGAHAGPVGFTQRLVNLVIETNGAFRTGAQTGIATGAQVQVNGVVLGPAQFKRAQPTGDAVQFAGQHRVTALLCATAFTCTHAEQGDIQRVGQ